MQKPDGALVERSKGTPQGGVISPLLANIYLHVLDATGGRDGRVSRRAPTHGAVNEREAKSGTGDISKERAAGDTFIGDDG